MVERGRMDYNYYRPHSSLDYATSVGLAGLCQPAGYLRSPPPVRNGVHDGGFNNDRAEYPRGI